MEMGVRSPHHRLQGPVEIAKRNITFDQNAPPDERAGGQQGHFDGIHFRGLRLLQATASSCAKNCASERMDFSLSSPKPRSSSSLSRPSYKSRPNTCVSREYR